MKRRVAIGLLASAALVTGAGLTGRHWFQRRAQRGRSPAPPPPPVGEISPIATNLYVVPGGGGNTAVFVTNDGVLVVDPKFPERAQGLIDQVRRITDKPITHVVNTHSHVDHAGGNDAMPADAEVIVHENTAENLARMSEADLASGRRRIPRTYRERLSLFDGEDAVDLYYFGAAHTNGDTLVVFRAARVMHAGDMFIDKTAPVINLPWGGDPAAYVETMAKATAGIQNVDRVITGHGPVRSWQEFVEHGEFIRLVVAQARAAMRAGKDVNRARAELDLPATFADYNLERLIFTFHDVYKGLTPWWRVW